MSRQAIAKTLGALALAGWSCSLQGGAINVPNNSFESPVTPFVSININSWQKSPKPAWYVEDPQDPVTVWGNRIGGFKNPAASDPDHIGNCDGLQAIWLFVVPEVGLFQDYDSLDWNDSVPSHDFNAQYEPGKSYQLTAGVIGTGGGMLEDATLELSLYYRDSASNRVAVAVTSLTNIPSVFSNNTHFLDCRVHVPVVKATDAWAGQKIGIQFLSTVPTNYTGGGYWDLDNVRLVSVLAPKFVNPAFTNGLFQFTVQSEPGLAFELFASTNLVFPSPDWTSLGVVTNSTGSIPFIDTSTNFNQRFYQVRQLP